MKNKSVDEMKAIDIMEDARKIQSIWFENDEGYQIGGNDILGITAIKPYHEKGELSYVIWFAVFIGDEIRYRINSKFIATIIYEKSENK